MSIPAAWSRSIIISLLCAWLCVGATRATNYTNLGKAGFCFGADNYYAGDISSAEVHQQGGKELLSLSRR
jgi:hypothetical protein